MSRFLLFSLCAIFALLIFIPFHSSLISSVNAQKDAGCAWKIGDKCQMIKTAIGDVTPSPQGLIRTMFRLVLGLSGGIALILIIISGYKFMASGNNPESFQAAKDTLVSAIVGLLFIIFSFVILQVIGVDILRIPGFNP